MLKTLDLLSTMVRKSPVQHDEQLPENEAVSALNCAFIGVGGAGGKLAKAFLDLGFNKTLLLNTTEKDQPEGVDRRPFDSNP